MGDDNETLWLAHQQAREGNYRMALLNYESIIDDIEISPATPLGSSHIPFQEYDSHGGGMHGENSTIYGTNGHDMNNIHKVISLAWHNKAVCLSRLGMTDEALVAAVNALKLDINNHKMIMNVAILLAEGLQFSEVCQASSGYVFNDIPSLSHPHLPPTFLPSSLSLLHIPSHSLVPLKTSLILSYIHHNIGRRGFR